MNKSIIYLGLLATLIAIFVSTYYAKDSYKIIPVDTKLNEKVEPPSQTWFEYDAPDGAFSVSLPLLPQTANQHLVDPKTDETKNYQMFVAQTDNGIIYMITLITMESEIDEDGKPLLLKQLMSDMVSANEGNKLQNSVSSDFHGLPSISFIIENDTHTTESKDFIDGNTIYLLSVISKKDNSEKTHFDYFINSFKLKSKEGK